MSAALEIDRLRERNAVLATKNGELTSTNGQLAAENRELVKKLDIYADEIAWYKSKLFGRGSEKLSGAEQTRLFDEVETSEDEQPDGQDEPQATEVPAHARRRAVRRPLPESLPRQQQVLDIPEADKRCACGHELVRIGEESSEKLDVMPPRLQVIRTVRPIYACHHCEGSGEEQRPAVRSAPAPVSLIPKGIATSGLLAYVATAKFCDALPLYRQEKQFARLGVELSRRTMADWMLAVARELSPVLEVLDERIRSGPMVQIDESSVQVLREPGRANTTLSYMWVMRGGPPGRPVLRYYYAPSRSGRVAAELLGDYQGFVQTDGYEGYDGACAQPGIVHVGCMAHARRGFVEAARALGKSSDRAGSAQQALALIAKLYRVESQLGEQRDTNPAGFVAARRERVEPILGNLHAWLRAKREQVLPSSALGKAVRYALEQWPKLIRYVECAQLTPDTNACEQAIRPFVVGRKNWLFSGSPRGAAASAAIYSVIETAKANGREPYWYLRELFEALPPARTRADYLALIPTPRPPPNSSP